MSNPEATAVCPYNKAHSIVLSRMQFHLTKCRAQHPNAEKATCPFNSTHIVNKIELDWHLEMCRDRVTVDNLVCKVGSESPFVNPFPTALPEAPTSTSTNEVWGDEDIVVQENILEKVKEVSLTKPTLHNKICAPKSERKAHKYNQRLRYQMVSNSVSSTTENPTVAPVRTEKENERTDMKNPGVQKNEVSSSSSCNKLWDSEPDKNPLSPSTTEAFPQIEAKGPKEVLRESQTGMKNSHGGSRDPKNPWGSVSSSTTSTPFNDVVESAKKESKNNFVTSTKDVNKNNVDKNEKPGAPAWGGWSRPATAAPTGPIENASSSGQQFSMNDRRDPGNPWKMNKIAASFQGPTNNEFPILPMSGQGRGRRSAK